MKFRLLITIPLLCLALLLSGNRLEAAGLESSFHRLVVSKQKIESGYGIKRLECFPFLKTIRDAEEEAQWVSRCLTGVEALLQALEVVPETGLRTVGISTRFLRTGGFGTLLVPWESSSEQMVAELKRRPTEKEQEELLARVKELKRTILTNFLFRDLYCSQTLSNDECLKGYTTLAGVEPSGALAKKSWGSVVVSDTLVPGEDPTRLLLRFDQSPEEMADRLLHSKAQDFFDERRHVYETMSERHGKVFERVLQVPNVFCDAELSAEECLQGAALLHTLSRDSKMLERPWGKVLINRNLTRIHNDYEVSLKFDGEVEEVTRLLARRPTREEVAAHITRTEALEDRLKNNRSGLRAVCDLHRLRSDLCVQAFETFVEFLKTHRDYKVAPPWDNLMFIDPTQLDRVNFALNSSSRDTYLYVDATADLLEMSAYLETFGSGGN